MSTKWRRRLPVSCRMLGLLLSGGVVLAGAGGLQASPQGSTVPPVSAAQLFLSPGKIALDARLGSSVTLTRDIDVTSSELDTPLTYTASIQAGADWLLLGTAISGTTKEWGPTVTASTPAVLRVFVKVKAMPAGTNIGTIALKIQGSTGNPTLLPVIVNVRQDPTLIMYPSSFSFHYQTGQLYNTLPAPQTLSVYGANTSFTVLVSTTSDLTWLYVTPDSSVTPASLAVNVDPSSLEPGTYEGTISLRSPDAQYSSLNTKVVLTVTSQPTFFSVPDSISLQAQFGSHQPVSVTAQAYTNGAQLPVSASVTNPSWLSVTALDAWAGEFDLATLTTLPVPARLRVSADPTGLAVGTYTNQITVGEGSSSVEVPVTLRILPNELIVPHIVDGGGISTAFTLINMDKEPAPFTLKFRQQDGSPLSMSLDVAGSVSEYSDVIPVGGMRVVHTLASAEQVVQGWAEIIPERSIVATAGFVQFGALSLTEASLPVELPLGQPFQLPFDNTEGVHTSLAVVNSGKADAPVSVTFRDEGGTQVGSASITVRAGGREVLQMPSQFPELANLRGKAEFRTASRQLGAVGIQTSLFGSVETFQPVVAQTASSNNSKLVLPLVVDGSTWSTTLVLTNAGPQPMPFSLAFKNPFLGGLQALTLSGVGNVEEYADVIPPGGVRIIESAGVSDSLEQRWAELASVGPIDGTVIFRQRQFYGATNAASLPVSDQARAHFIMPFDNSSGLTTSLALMNTAEADGLSTVSVRDENGKWLGTDYFTVSGSSCATTFLSAVFPVTDGIRGTVEFTGARLWALGLRFSSFGTFTPVPAISK